MHDVPYGLCHCGCGEKTSLARQTDKRRGWVIREPIRFVSGHNTQRRAALIDLYVEEDRGHGTPCWIWQGSLITGGYGQTSWQGRTRPAHVVFYERQCGPIPDGLELDHLCRNPACVNPEHLEPVTEAENMAAAPQITDLQAEVKRSTQP